MHLSSLGSIGSKPSVLGAATLTSDSLQLRNPSTIEIHAANFVRYLSGATLSTVDLNSAKKVDKLLTYKGAYLGNADKYAKAGNIPVLVDLIIIHDWLRDPKKWEKQISGTNDRELRFSTAAVPQRVLSAIDRLDWVKYKDKFGTFKEYPSAAEIAFQPLETSKAAESLDASIAINIKVAGGTDKALSARRLDSVLRSGSGELSRVRNQSNFYDRDKPWDHIAIECGLDWFIE